MLWSLQPPADASPRVLQLRIKKRDALVTAALHIRKKEAKPAAASLNNLIACFKVRLHKHAAMLCPRPPAGMLSS